MQKITNNTLSQCIYFHRKKSGLTRIALAKFAGVGKTVIYDIEHEKKTVQLDTLLKILNVLNISLLLDSPLMKNFEETQDVTS